MKFCDICRAFLPASSEGLICPKCGHVAETDVIEIRRNGKGAAEPVIVMDSPERDASPVNQTCPSCGHAEAYRTVLTTQGEHAGVKQDRSVERFRCAECGHTWTRN
jgi:DNA-directed RNA polymerase subunit M/transcription elongation factor TFIIS